MSPLRAFSLFESVDQFDEEEIFADSAGEPTEFDAVVGAIEDIVVGESFQVTFRDFEMARIIPVSPSLPMSVCNTSPISSRVISLTKSKNLASLAGITNVLISQVLIGLYLPFSPYVRLTFFNQSFLFQINLKLLLPKDKSIPLYSSCATILIFFRSYRQSCWRNITSILM